MSQANASARWILVGGASRAASAIAAGLSAPVIRVVRSPAGLPNEHLVEDFDRGPGTLQLSGATIVNCAGTPHGSAGELDRANHAVPLAWATAADQQGAARFVQLSSFSVFGSAPRIDDNTPVAPTSEYGRSKLAAEKALLSLLPPDRLTILRVPILVGGGNDKLAQLVALSKRTGVVPAAPWPTPRSMLSYDALAATVIASIGSGRSGTLSVADPLPFEPELLAKRARAAGLVMRIARAPRPLLALARRIAPRIHSSLFQPSLLADHVNAVAQDTEYERVVQVIDRYLARDM